MMNASARLALVLALAVSAPAAAADPSWMPHVESLLAQPGQGPAALAFLAARPLSERQSHGALWLQARAAQAAGETGTAAEAIAVATLLVPGPARDFAAVRAWLAARAREAQARALAVAARTPALAVPHYLIAVKADGAVLADDDRGLRAASIAALRAAAAAAPADGRARFELGWHLYFQGDNGAARPEFERARDLAAGPYDKWQSQLWVDRIDREAASARAADAASDARAATERAAADKELAEAEKKAAAAKAKKAEDDKQAELAEAKKRRHEILLEMIEADKQINTLRERRMINVKGSGLSAQGVYNYLSELKAEEDAVRARKRKLEEERDALPR